MDSARPVYGRRAPEAHRQQAAPGLRQIDEFTTSLQRIRRGGLVAAGLLIVLSLLCVSLSAHGVEVAALYSTGAVLLLLQMLVAGVAYWREEKRAARAYWDYLDGYSYQALSRLASESRLSAWSRHELKRYLAVAHIVW
ncbi:hypothetical protein BH11PSE11_BH11PSE11_03230 [soil metagenome]